MTDDALSKLLPELVQVRHDLHKHPELGFEEHRTQSVITKWLEKLGYQPRVCAETGVIADLNPGSASKRTIALRADMDCLPIQEETDLPYRSVHAGRAHKCGHDGHTTILMGVAALLAERREKIPGNVRLIFQPAEEGARGGGAKVMVEEGALSEVAEVYGLHSWPAWDKGDVRVKAGAVMAHADLFEITVAGKGGHGSQPHLARDPIVAACRIVDHLTTIVSRNVPYDDSAVLSIGSFHAGTASNIIPDVARISGTLRTFSEPMAALMHERIKEILEGTTRAFSVGYDLRISAGYPVLHNDPDCAKAVARVGTRIVGAKHTKPDGLPMAGGEDFAYFAQTVPGAYFFLGAKKEGEDTPICHHPDFDFDDDLIPLGIRMFLGLVEDRLSDS